VVVDDIDRLHADELQSAMKAVRLLGRFDEKTVLDVLESSDICQWRSDLRAPAVTSVTRA
jgi:hypothetical protein